MEGVPHCILHRKRPVEYMCLSCKNIPMCETCKLEHKAVTGHALESCKEIGLAIMNQHIQCSDGRLANELAKGLRKVLKDFETGFLQDINRLQSSCVQTEELRKMQKLGIEGRYAELYFYAKSLPAGGAKNEAKMREQNKRLLKTVETASSELKKVLSEIAAAQHRPAFAAYKKDEVFTLKPEFYKEEWQIVSALKTADILRRKAAYIDSWPAVGDRAASELASRLQTSPVSTLYLKGCNITDTGAEVLAQAAFNGKPFSAFCIASGRISDIGAKAVAEAARNYRSLTTLYLYGLEISDYGAKAVAKAVKGCPLSVFCLGSSIISDSGAMVVAEAVKDCPLSAFCLWSDEMSDAGAIAVTKTMKDYPLSALYLGGCKISDSGATDVAGILSNSGCANTLSSFYLGGGISDPGAKKVADMVRGCPLLSAFYIEGNPISGEMAAYILEGVADVSTIRSVNLCVGGIGKEQMDSCLDRLQQSGVAKQLNLRFRCGTEAAKSVCEKFETEWNAKLAEFRIAPSISRVFIENVILGVPK